MNAKVGSWRTPGRPPGYRASTALSRVVILIVSLAVLGSACGGGGGQVGGALVPSVSPSGAPVMYVAIGASESVGYGAANPASQAWPQVFQREVLPRSTTFIDLGIPGETLALALANEVPSAIALHPQVVTIWLNANDIIRGVPVGYYRRELSRLISEMRGAGAQRILVANTPPLTRLPRYLACQPFAPNPDGGCTATRLPPARAIRIVASYNAAIARVVSTQGVDLVDLNSAFSALSSAQSKALVAGDGFHPNAAGYAFIAKVFADGYRGALGPGGSGAAG